jgi:hypothetical protein
MKTLEQVTHFGQAEVFALTAALGRHDHVKNGLRLLAQLERTEQCQGLSGSVGGPFGQGRGHG